VGIYGHRLNLYRATIPHRGFEILKEWAARMPVGARIFTSNVDGQFQRAGFSDDIIAEVHGSIHHAKCMGDCGIGIFSAAGFVVEVDVTTFRAIGFPHCPSYGGLARPNILMFGDWDWDDSLVALEHQRLDRWLDALGKRRLAVIELGAGVALPTVPHFSEMAAASSNATLIRINPRESHAPAGQIGIALGALEALDAIHPGLPPTSHRR
jgi:NAD-dependent SIR2 family protein deacetylase